MPINVSEDRKNVRRPVPAGCSEASRHHICRGPRSSSAGRAYKEAVVADILALVVAVELTEVLAGMLLAAGLLLVAVSVNPATDPSVPLIGAAAAAAGVGIETYAGRMSMLVAAVLAVGVGAMFLLTRMYGTGVIGTTVIMFALVRGWEAGPGWLAFVMSTPVWVVALFIWTRDARADAALARASRHISGAAPGDRGAAVSALRPSGTARFNGRDIEVRIKSGSAEPGDPLVVLRIDSEGILVERPRA
jgi:hypothetical protein